MSEIRDKIRKMIVENFLEGRDASVLDDNTSFERSHIVDSARALEVIMFVEETFDIVVENEDAIRENFDSIQNITDYVGRKIAARG